MLPDQRSLLPHQLTQESFRYYEPFLALGVKNFPEETAFDLDLIPKDERRAPTTFVARFRDAIVSLKKYGWTPTTVDVEKLWQITGKYRIWWEPGSSKVWFKQRLHKGAMLEFTAEARARGALVATSPPLAAPFRVVPWKDATDIEIRAIVLLVASKRLDGPFEFYGPVKPLLVEELMSTYDVALTWDEVRGVTVLT